MKCTIPEISWHNRDPVLSVDIQLMEKHNTYRIVTGGADSHVLIWYLSEGETGIANVEFASDLSRHQKAVNVVRFSPNGELLASGDDESVIIVWKQKTDQDLPEFPSGNLDEENVNKENWIVTKILRGHLDDVYDISWSPTSTQLISGSVDNTAILWDVVKGKNIGVLTENKKFVQGVAWDPKNQYVATLSSDRSLRTYSIQSKKVISRACKSKLPVDSSHELFDKVLPLFHDDTMKSFFRRLCFSPDGQLLIAPSGVFENSESGKKSISVTHIFTRGCLNKPAVCLPSLQYYSVAVKCCPVLFELKPSEEKPLFKLPYRMVIAVATENNILLYDTQHAIPFAFIANIHYTKLTDVSWSKDGKFLLASSTDGYCSIISFGDKELGIPYVEIQTATNLEESKENIHQITNIIKNYSDINKNKTLDNQNNATNNQKNILNDKNSDQNDEKIIKSNANKDTDKKININTLTPKRKSILSNNKTETPISKTETNEITKINEDSKQLNNDNNKIIEDKNINILTPKRKSFIEIKSDIKSIGNEDKMDIDEAKEIETNNINKLTPKRKSTINTINVQENKDHKINDIKNITSTNSTSTSLSTSFTSTSTDSASTNSKSTLTPNKKPRRVQLITLSSPNRKRKLEEEKAKDLILEKKYEKYIKMDKPDDEIDEEEDEDDDGDDEKEEEEDNDEDESEEEDITFDIEKRKKENSIQRNLNKDIINQSKTSSNKNEKNNSNKESNDISLNKIKENCSKSDEIGSTKESDDISSNKESDEISSNKKSGEIDLNKDNLNNIEDSSNKDEQNISNKSCIDFDLALENTGDSILNPSFIEEDNDKIKDFSNFNKNLNTNSNNINEKSPCSSTSKEDKKDNYIFTPPRSKNIQSPKEKNITPGRRRIQLITLSSPKNKKI